MYKALGVCKYDRSGSPVGLDETYLQLFFDVERYLLPDDHENRLEFYEDLVTWRLVRGENDVQKVPNKL